jgi:hypothetical protein
MNNVEMSNSSENVRNKNTRKRKRNWYNSSSSPKRSRLNKKSVRFNNTPNTRNLNMSEAMKEARRSIKTNKVTRNSPNIEQILSKKTNHKTYRKKLLGNLKNKGILFKDI